MAYDRNNIFARIIRGEIPCKKVYEDEFAFAFQDINPQAPVHVLVLPEHHVDTFREVGELGGGETHRMLEFVADTARGAGLEDYKVQVNVGPSAGQTVFHLHWHILGRRPFHDEVRPHTTEVTEL